jgi:hypothetical protein
MTARVDSSMRCRFAFRAWFRLHRKQRGFLPLKRALFHRRLKQWPAERVARVLEAIEKGEAL